MAILTPKEHHDHTTLKFPPGFLWGTATSAHQVEGHNTSSDWWQWEKTRPQEKRSGQAADQYNLFAADFDLAQGFNHNAHRLSIEWARIEPKEGEFDPHEIEHYIEVLKALKKRKLKVMLTLWHFSLPQWVSDKGGWENGATIKYFQRFVSRVVPELQDFVDLWITLNEPQVLSYCGYLIGVWPPQKKSKWAALKVTWNLAQAHKKAYKIIHKFVPNAQVGVACNIGSWSAFHHHSIRESIAEWLLDLVENHFFYFLTGKDSHDFLGLNYYFNHYISFNGESSRLPSIVDIAITKKDVTDMGWEILPEGIFDILMDFSDYHKPIYITENGLASTNDDRRCRFLIGYLKEIYHAIEAGANVEGYFHWSLIDNFEWADGFNPRFGLVEVDFNTQKRTPRPSAYIYSQIAKDNGIAHHLLRFIGHTVKAEEVLCYKHDGPKAYCEHIWNQHYK